MNPYHTKADEWKRNNMGSFAHVLDKAASRIDTLEAQNRELSKQLKEAERRYRDAELKIAAVFAE